MLRYDSLQGIYSALLHGKGVDVAGYEGFPIHAEKWAAQGYAELVTSNSHEQSMQVADIISSSRGLFPIVRLPMALTVILGAKAQPYKHWSLVKSPFPSFHVEFDSELIYVHTDPAGREEELHLYGMTVVTTEVDSVTHVKSPILGIILHCWYWVEDSPELRTKIHQAFPVVIEEFDAEGNPLQTSLEEWDTIQSHVRNILDFLTLPTVRIERTSMAKVNKKRQASGKAPLTDFHTVQWTRESIPGTHGKAGYHHQVRYDVRGHWRTHETGERVWIRPHQRGPLDAPFRSKGYEVNR